MSDFTLSKILQRTFIIAEAGKNFIQSEDDRPVDEYLENAKALAMAAKDSGADAVKFQTHNVEDEQLNINVTSPHFRGLDRYTWVSRNTKSTPIDSFWEPLKKYCNEIGILFHSTPMSRGAAQKLNDLVGFWKVGSGDILDFVLLDYLASTKKPIILSSGMSTEEELDQAVSFLKKRKAELVLLHCVSKYPCPPEELRLSTMAFLEKKYQVPVGFSDHSVGIDSALAAVALGAKIIEKHFSFSRSFWGSDHKVSMTPDELKNMAGAIRDIESDPRKKQSLLETEAMRLGLGDGMKTLQEGEAVFRPYFRKSLVAAQDIEAGSIIHSSMIYAMRPQGFAGGLPSEKYEETLGKRVIKSIKKYEPINPEILA